MKIYISGKITDTVDYVNRFANAEKYLEKEYPDAEIVNPVNLSKKVESEIINPSWQDYMKEAICNLLECDAIYLIDGWQNSKGARLEYFIASCLDFTFI